MVENTLIHRRRDFTGVYFTKVGSTLAVFSKVLKLFTEVKAKSNTSIFASIEVKVLAENFTPVNVKVLLELR